MRFTVAVLLLAGLTLLPPAGKAQTTRITSVDPLTAKAGDVVSAIGEGMDAANVDLKAFTEDFYRKQTASELAPVKETHRNLNVHRNVPGVLRDINRIVSEKGANIAAQVLATDPELGYLVMDLDQDVSRDVKNAIAALETNIKTRILY